MHSPDDVVVARRQAYDGFIREHHRVLLRNARWLCEDNVLGEDLPQEALLEIRRRHPVAEYSGGPAVTHPAA